MQLVVDIPEDYYRAIKEIPVEHSTADMMIIRNGTPLPAGHGGLIDVDSLIGKIHGVRSISAVVDVPIIIPADTEV